MEKRLVLAIVLSVLVLFLYNLYYFYKETERRQKYKKPTEQENIPPASISPLPKTTAEIVKEKISEIEKEKPTLKIKPEELILRTNLMRIELSPQGEINSWKLLKYKEKNDDLVEIATQFSGKANYPLKILFGNSEFIVTDFSTLDDGGKKFVYTNPDMSGIKLIKQIFSYPDSYAIDVNITVVNNSTITLKNQELALQWESPPNPRYGTASHSTILAQQCFINGKMENIKHKSKGLLDGILAMMGLIPPVTPEDSVQIKEGKISWIAQESHYFLNILLSNEFVEKAIFTKKVDGHWIMSLVIPKIHLLPEESRVFKFKVYGGPKDTEILKSLAFGAEKLTGIGILGGVAQWSLKKLYGLTHNYGTAIILLTIIVKIILHPLTRKNFIVMKDMQKKMKLLQPELEKLKEKYKNDKETLNREMMALYKKYKINPLGGCLPLLLQIPVFIALFTALNKCIELRGASFLIWDDLSSKDPLFILPILMGATMFIQQKMTPVVDPLHAKIGKLMCILFTFIFLQFPAGLVLYWLVQNILTIGEQYLINRGIEK